jgi:hypothetical protein
VPANLVTTNDTLVMSEVAYGYKPRMFDYFLKKAFGASGSAGTYTLRQTVYMKPRALLANLVVVGGIVPCPGPTF